VHLTVPNSLPTIQGTTSNLPVCHIERPKNLPIELPADIPSIENRR
jgi:hypothetical protein